VNFVSFPTSILQSEEYRKYPAMRYYIYGGFHHVSIEHARARHADIICIAPDGVQSDGAFSRFVELIDEGYEAVLFTSIRAQAEAVLPLLDRFRSEDGTTLAIPAAELVLMSTQHIHHDFLRHFLFRGNRRIPGFQSILFFLNPRGFIVRCFHIHPIIMSFEAISRDIVFDYATVDGNTLLRIFPDPARFESLKIIQDTREGLMMDLAYTYEEYPTPEIEFEQRNLLRHTNLLGPNHYWHFLHPVEYRCERAIAHIGSYERQADGSLKRLEIPISSGLPVADTDIETFLRTHLTEEFAAVNIPR
jgi:hypothetical protein